MNKFFASQRVKRNCIFIGIIVLVILSAVMLNAILTVLGEKYNWYVDMTEEGLYTISDQLTSILDVALTDTEGKKVPEIEIIFCCTEEYAKSNYSNLDDGDTLAYVYSTATQLEEKYDKIHISYHDVKKEPSFFKNHFTEIERFLNSMENPVIVAKRGENEKGELHYGTFFKVYAARSFYGFSSTDSSLYAYNGEKVFASAILSLTADEVSTVYFTTGHNERLEMQTTAENKPPVELINLFTYCGFTVSSIDLSKDNIPSDARMVIINEPEFDFDDVEIEKLESYASGTGSIMIFSNPSYHSNLSNLYTMLETRCGVTVNTNGKVTDESTKLTTDPFSLKGEVSSNNAANTYLKYLANATAAKPFFTDASTISIDSKYTSDEGVYEGDSQIFTLPLFQTTNSGKYNGVSGNHLLMSVTSIEKERYNPEINNTEPIFSYIVFCPSSGFASDDALQNPAYPNQDIVLSLVHSMTSVQTTVDLDYKAFINYKLDITEKQATTALILLAVVVPVCVIAVGGVLIVRRKRR